MKPMVYMEYGGWGMTCGDDEDDPVWVEPGWYEVALDAPSQLPMFRVKEDIEPEWSDPTFCSISLLDCDLDIEFASWKIEGPFEVVTDTGTISSPLLRLNNQILDQHPLHLGLCPGWSTLWCGESRGTRMGELGDSSSAT